jgi:hypothetical protein
MATVTIATIIMLSIMVMEIIMEVVVTVRIDVTKFKLIKSPANLLVGLLI